VVVQEGSSRKMAERILSDRYVCLIVNDMKLEKS